MRRWLVKHLPSAAVRLFAGPYIAGDSLQAAMRTASGLYQQDRLLATLDILGEESRKEEDAAEFAQLYAQALDAIAAYPESWSDRSRPTLSFKPSALTRVVRRADGSIDQDATSLDTCLGRIRDVTTKAQTLGIDVTLDMEDRHWTEFTVATCERLVGEGLSNFGTVLQTRLHRTEADLERVPPGTRIRLVIGIYEEPESAAVQSRSEMKERLLSYGKRLLERGVDVEVATHDEKIVERWRREVLIPGGYAPERVEFQFLLGVPRRTLQHQLLDEGYRVRLYVPFATEWQDAVAYARRRLIENPSIMTYGLKNFFRLRNR